MSKKNNKSRSKAYVDYLREEEKKLEEARKHKQIKKDTNRITNNLTNEINEMTLNLEKEQKMTVERSDAKISNKKNKKVAKKHKVEN
jgi:hypothetical protein